MQTIEQLAADFAQAYFAECQQPTPERADATFACFKRLAGALHRAGHLTEERTTNAPHPPLYLAG